MSERRSAFVFRFARTLFVAVLLILPAAASAAIELPAHPRGATTWAAGRLQEALKAAFGPANAAEILVSRDRASKPVTGAFTIRPEGDRLVVTATEPDGELYGLLELTEEIANRHENGDWHAFVSQFTPVRQSPAVAFRADNPFLHIERAGISGLAQKLHLIKPPPLFEDRGMWKQYLDMLAECRFNVMDLHGLYNVPATTFHNLLPRLVTVPEYPGVGDPRDQQRNLNDLRRLISHANKRGIKLALMNYSTRVDGLPESSLRDYTQKAVCILLKELPKLKQFGFRVGESGETAQFFADAYVQGLRDSGRNDVRLYTRSWKTTPAELDTLAASLPTGLDVEIKYNGEQLGLPYQAIQGPANSHYSYGDFLQPGRRYDAIWQVRANGTHRFWTWADADFIRRAASTFSFGGAKGFSLEPETAYFDLEAASAYRTREDQAVYRYAWQRNWPWYLAWGRLTYNPSLPAETLTAAYAKHFGTAGAEVYAAVQASGGIVPAVLAYRFTGPDQRNMSPETQTGAFDTVKHAAVTPLSFAENSPMDPRSFVGISDFAQEKSRGETDGRIGPLRMAKILATDASETQRLLPFIDHALPGNGQWRLLKADLLSASWLGQYYSERILGTMHLDYALRTGSQADFDLAQNHLAQSRTAWSHLAETADAIYAPIQNPQIDQRDFTWASQNKPLANLDATVAAMWAAHGPKASAKPLAFTASEAGLPFACRLEELRHDLTGPDAALITCKLRPAAPIKSVTLWAKDFPSAAEWKPWAMKGSGDGTFTAAVSTTPAGLLYLVEVETIDRDAAQFPSPLVGTPYRIISAAELRATARPTGSPPGNR